MICQNDLSVTANDDLRGDTAAASPREICPSLVVMVLLAGVHHVSVDSCECTVAADTESDDGTVLVFNTARASRLNCAADPGAPGRSVVIAAPHAWMDLLIGNTAVTDPVLREFRSTHLARLTVRASRHVRRVAEQIIDPPPALEGEILAFHRRSRALDLLCQACAVLHARKAGRPHPQLASRRRSERVRDYVLANLDKTLTIETIAAEIGASVSSVQRHFKEHFRMTVFEFIRSERLAQACAALERDGVTIAQAAYVAGYADPSNFTVAFKRAYGVSPKHKRR